MSRDMCADIKMEEGYMRMSVEYNNDDSKAKIQAAIANAEKTMKLYPSVLRKSISPTAGNFSVEFNDDSMQREGGGFCDRVIEELGIKNCGV